MILLLNHSDWKSWDSKHPTWRIQDMPPDAGLTFSNLELIEMYRWVAEAFGMTFDVGSSRPKCKVDDLSPTTTPEAKKSRESIRADVAKEGKAGEIMEGDLNMEDQVDEPQDHRVIVKIGKVKVKTGKKSSKDKVKKEKRKLKRKENENETGKGNERKEEVIVKLETDDAGEGEIEEDNGSSNDLDVEDVKDAERAQLKGKEKEKEKEKREEVKKEEKRMVKVEGKGKAKEIRVSVNCTTRRSARNSSKHTVTLQSEIIQHDNTATPTVIDGPSNIGEGNMMNGEYHSTIVTLTFNI